MASSLGGFGTTSLLVTGAGRFDLDSRMATARQLEAAGRFAEAETIYRQVAGLHPNHHPAWTALGVLAHRAGDLAGAISLTEKALGIDDRVALNWRNLCELRRQAGLLPAALEAGRRAVRLAADDPEAHFNLGLVQAESGDQDRAIASYRRALHLAPKHGRAWNNLGHVLLNKGHQTEARDAFRRAVEIDPSNAEAHNNLGIIARTIGDLAAARTAFERALALKPNLHAAAEALRRIHEDPPAAAPADPVAAGIAAWSDGRYEDALPFYDLVLAERPDDVVALANRATCLADMGRPADALVSAERALALRPEAHTVRLVIGHCQLELGRWKEGWENYEARYSGSHEVTTGRVAYPTFPMPQWNGEAGTEDKSIMIVVEQGYGDVLQFCRYLHLLKKRFARIGLLVSPPLLRLMEWTFGEEVAIFGYFPSDYADWDLHCRLMSLPRAFGTLVDTVPAEVPYLRVPAPALGHWRRRLDAAGASGPRIGLAWAGRPEHRLDKARSVPFEELAPLLAVPGPTWVSLQKRDEGADGPAIPQGVRWIDWTPEFTDFATTASVIAGLDLVICVDTAIVHLAAALGVPTWMMNRHNSEWRWMAPRTDSPWYPTLRIFHQPARDDWRSVVAAVAAALTDVVAAPKAAPAKPRAPRARKKS